MVKMLRGPHEGTERDLATRQAKAAVKAGDAAYVNPPPPEPSAPPVAPATGSWLGGPGEVPPDPAADRPKAEASGSWLGPPGEQPPPATTGTGVQTSAPAQAPPPPTPAAGKATSTSKKGGAAR